MNRQSIPGGGGKPENRDQAYAPALSRRESRSPSAPRRRLRGFTQEELADRLGVSLRHVAHIEKGTRTLSFEILEGLGEALGVSAEALFGRAEAGIHAEEFESEVAILREGSPAEIRFAAEILRLLRSGERRPARGKKTRRGKARRRG